LSDRVTQKQGRARDLYEESLTMRRETTDQAGIADCLEGLAMILWTVGCAGRAVQLCARAEALCQAIGTIRQEPDFRLDYAQHLAALKEAMGEKAFASAWAEGQRLTLDQAIACAEVRRLHPPAGRGAPGAPRCALPG
jgi:hypothetical protein